MRVGLVVVLLLPSCGYQLVHPPQRGSFPEVEIARPDVTACDEPRLAAELAAALARALPQQGVRLAQGPTAARLTVRVAALEPVSVAVRGAHSVGERWRLVVEARLHRADRTLVWRSGLLEAQASAPLPSSMGSAEASRAALRRYLALRVAERLALALSTR